MVRLRSRGGAGARYRRYNTARTTRLGLDAIAAAPLSTGTPPRRRRRARKSTRKQRADEKNLRGVLIKIVNSRLAARRVRLEEVVAVRLAQLVERARLDLADALARDAEHGADLLQGSRAPVVQAEAQSNHIALPV